MGVDTNSWRDRKTGDDRVRSVVNGGDVEGYGGESMERIIGIKRTIDVRVTEGGEGQSTAEEEMFRAVNRK